MSGPTPPPSSQDAHIKRETSASPALPPEVAPVVMSTESHEEEDLFNTIEKDLSNGNIKNDPANSALETISEGFDSLAADIERSRQPEKIRELGILINKRKAANQVARAVGEMHDAFHSREGSIMNQGASSPLQNASSIRVKEPITPLSNDIEEVDETLFVEDNSAERPAAAGAAPKRKRDIFDDMSDVSDFSEAEGSDSELEDLFISNSPTKPSASSRSPRARKTGRRLARTAREWHKNHQDHLKQKFPAQLRGTALKQQQIRKLREKFAKEPSERGSPQKRNVKQPKRKSAARVDPRSFLNGGRSKFGADNASGEGDSGPAPKVPTGSNKSTFWTEFKKLNRDMGIDLHKCSVDWNGLVKATRTFGLHQVQLDNTRRDKIGVPKWRVNGMDARLYDHQVLGVEFMVARECAEDAPFGSICADEMGMGKTVETIATIVLNPPTPEHKDRNEKTTLIIVPSSLKTQWCAEIKKHAPELTVKHFKASDPENTAATLKLHDIVITSYWQLYTSIPSPDKKTVRRWIEDRLDLFQNYQKWIDDREDLKGLLHQITWYRVILDEGHFIKNHLSRTSRAATNLKSYYRMLLSGTPIMNRYSEFYALLLFLGEPLVKRLTPQQFFSTCCNPEDGLAAQSLSIILSDLIIHRTKKDELFGKAIVDLPKVHRRLKNIQSLPSERMVTFLFELRLKELRNMDLKKRDPRIKLRNIRAQLTRLRQLTANLDIIAQQIILVFTVHELEHIQQKLKAMKVPRQTKSLAHMLYNRLAMWIQDKKDKVYEQTALEDDTQAICMNCLDVTEELLTLKVCQHTFCEICLEQRVERDMIDEEEVSICPLPTCSEPFKESDKKYYEAPQPSGNGGAKNSKSSIRKGKDVCGIRPTPGPNQPCFVRWLEKIDAGEIAPLPCAKSTAVLEQIRAWKCESPNDKIIVFTQFRHFQTIVGCMLQKEKINFVYYSGDMTMKQREKTKQMFKEQEHIQVMVAGLKCGGLGLNLNFANRVMVSDMWWNTCIDDQAFGRVHRIGQEKETHYAKLAVIETVDARIIEMQERKQKAINKVMQDDLTPEEYQELLGGYDQTFEEFMNNIDNDPRLKVDGDFIDVDDL